MPTDNYDRNVARIAYATAKSAGSSPKVLLALFEAGIVESGFRNLGHQGSNNDHDSLGFLQQRPSQGWPNPMDVPTATRSFVSRAKPIEGKYATSGQLAQAVQRSAFPLKYDAVKPAAEAFLREISGGVVIPIEDGTSPATGSLDNLNKVVDTIKSPNTWRRVLLFIVGLVLIFIGMMKLTGNNEISPTVKKLAKLAIMRKVSK